MKKIQNYRLFQYSIALVAALVAGGASLSAHPDIVGTWTGTATGQLGTVQIDEWVIDDDLGTDGTWSIPLPDDQSVILTVDGQIDYDPATQTMSGTYTGSADVTISRPIPITSTVDFVLTFTGTVEPAVDHASGTYDLETTSSNRLLAITDTGVFDIYRDGAGGNGDGDGKTPEPGTWQALFPQAVDMGGGWKWSEWFGYFDANSFPLIYHNEHGWMFCLGEAPENIWFWTDDLGWLWSGLGVYAFMYNQALETWLWYSPDSANPRWFFNYNSGLWLTDEQLSALVLGGNEGTDDGVRAPDLLTGLTLLIENEEGDWMNSTFLTETTGEYLTIEGETTFTYTYTHTGPAKTTVALNDADGGQWNIDMTWTTSEDGTFSATTPRGPMTGDYTIAITDP